MKVAVIGCGGIGKAHAAAYRALGEEIVYMMDTSAEAARAASAEFGAKPACSIEEMAGPLDAVSVATPPMAHTEPVLALLRRGVPVFSEKPLAMDLREAREIVRLSEQTGVPVGMGFKMRYEPVFRRARQEIARLGKLYAVCAVKCQPYTPRPNGWVPQAGCMYELSVHEYDLIEWIAGIQPLRVRAELQHAMGWPREDRAYLEVEYTGGVRGQLMSFYLPKTRFSFADLTLTFVGERGYLRIERPGRLFLHTDSDEVIEVLPEDNAALFQLELEGFLRSLREGKAFRPNAGDGMRITAMVEAARRSGESEGWEAVG